MSLKEMHKVIEVVKDAFVIFFLKEEKYINKMFLFIEKLMLIVYGNCFLVYVSFKQSSSWLIIIYQTC